MSLVNETLKLPMYCKQQCYIFIAESEALLPYNFSAKNITATDFLSTIRLNESGTDDLVKLTMF